MYVQMTSDTLEKENFYFVLCTKFLLNSIDCFGVFFKHFIQSNLPIFPVLIETQEGSTLYGSSQKPIAIFPFKVNNLMT